MTILKFLKFSYRLVNDFNYYSYVNTAHQHLAVMLILVSMLWNSFQKGPLRAINPIRMALERNLGFISF